MDEKTTGPFNLYRRKSSLFMWQKAAAHCAAERMTLGDAIHLAVGLWNLHMDKRRSDRGDDPIKF